jgi:hypothetical protein
MNACIIYAIAIGVIFILALVMMNLQANRNRTKAKSLFGDCLVNIKGKSSTIEYTTLARGNHYKGIIDIDIFNDKLILFPLQNSLMYGGFSVYPILLWVKHPGHIVFSGKIYRIYEIEVTAGDRLFIKAHMAPADEVEIIIRDINEEERHWLEEFIQRNSANE